MIRREEAGASKTEKGDMMREPQAGVMNFENGGKMLVAFRNWKR